MTTHHQQQSQSSQPQDTRMVGVIVLLQVGRIRNQSAADRFSSIILGQIRFLLFNIAEAD